MEIIKKFSNLPKSQVFILSLLLGGLYWFVLMDDGTQIQNKIKAAKQQMGSLNAEVEQLNKEIKELESVKLLIASAGNSLEAFMNLISEDADISKTIEEVSKVSAKVKAKLKDLKVSPPTGDQFGFEKTGFEVKMEAYYEQLMLFLSAITQFKHQLVIVDTIKISANQSASGGKKVDESGERGLSISTNFLTYSYRKKDK